jgi:putative proteasome-type protease
MQKQSTGSNRVTVVSSYQGEVTLTYCVGILLKEGIVMASDSRTHAGVDNFAQFCKMSVFEREGDRAVVLLSSGNLAGTQAVISILSQRGSADDGKPNVWSVGTMFDFVTVVSDAVRDVGNRDRPHLERSDLKFDASFIIGGQIKGEAPRLFRTYAEGNFVEAGNGTQFFQTGEAKYGKPIIDRVINAETSLADASKCVLVSFDSTMRSNLSVAMPIDLVQYQNDQLKLKHRRRFEPGDPDFAALSRQWSEGVRSVFRQLPDIRC